MRAHADEDAIRTRIERGLVESDFAIGVVDHHDRLQGFSLFRTYQRSVEDLDTFFSGRRGVISTEFVVADDDEASAIVLAEAIASIEAPFVVVQAPIAAAWCERALLERGFVASGVESIRQSYVVKRNTIHLSEGVLLRRATDDDMDAIVNLMLEEWRFLTSFHPHARDLWTDEHGRIALRSSLSQMLHERDDARLIVAESRGELAGVVSLRQFDVADATNPLPVGRHVSIEDISVRTSLRGQGLGRALVQATYDAFRDSKIAGYSVAYVADNPIARRLWPHLGFRTHKRTYVRKA